MDNIDLAKEIWNQTSIPVVIRRTKKGEKHRLRLPFAKHNRIWLSSIGRSEPTWLGRKKYWEIPKSWFNNFVEQALSTYGVLYIIQPYREMEKCAPACQNATGHECQCSCMGANHGQGSDGTWFDVDETFSFRWTGEQLACRLLKARTQ